MTRFMAPRYFTQEQNDAVAQSLLQIGIDDEEGVRIFIIALEYELAEYEKCGPSNEPQQAKSETLDPELDSLSRYMAETAQLLEQTAESSRQLLLDNLSTDDPFVRCHEQAYLDAVAAEMKRIATACTNGRPVQTVVSNLGASEKHFVSVVAEAYFECFETSPRADDGEPFTNLLRRIIEISGLQIPLKKEELEPILSTIG